MMVVFSKPTKTMGYHNSEPKQSTECLLQRTPTRRPKPYRSTAGHPTRLPPAPNPIRGRSSNGGSRITRDHKSTPAVRRPPSLPVRLPPIHRSAISNQQSATSNQQSAWIRRGVTERKRCSRSSIGPAGRTAICLRPTKTPSPPRDRKKPVT